MSLRAKITDKDSGAFAFGSNSVARYRPQAFAGQAKNLGKPVVMVLATHALEIFGLVDQQNALLWVNAHIRDFGGDPSNITALGVSAGSASIHHHLLSGVPLFDRAIMMSDVALTLGPYPVQALENSWRMMCGRYELTQATPAKRVEVLRKLEPLDLLEAYSTGVAGPVADGKRLPLNWGFADPMPSSRCKAIIIGDTNAESIGYKPLVKQLSQTYFH
ncbi:uncharacterized protein N7484_000745 [Penicillium longicatenatum]|uniref:uncharacterized protein n=1 Tax=Penicillium longicatenatum TaxID=1561947 RepID=UPI002548BF81|nr:uncharacterized protein N7484_000745 [Penicillium longicatenatum]KAJ5661373.1 hypothetical protein N7484_000745 [Penicillium longicatenatum]